MAYGVCDEHLTGWAGLGVGARLARFLGLPESLAEAVRLQRGCRAAQRLLALLSAACAGGGCLRAVDALGADAVVRRAGGLCAGPPSRRLGASLQRRHRTAREGLQECARLVSRRLTPLGRGTASSSAGPSRCAGTARRARSRAGCASTPSAGTTARGSPGCTRCAGVRRGSAPGCPQAVRMCRGMGGSSWTGTWCRCRWGCGPPASPPAGRWGVIAARDAAVSGTAPRHKAPLLRQVAAMERREATGEPLDPESRERATTGAYQPARWPEKQVSVGIRRDGDGEQRLLAPVYTVMLGSQDRWPLAELGRLPRGQQGQEHACQGPWTDLGLQHPPGRSPAAH